MEELVRQQLLAIDKKLDEVLAYQARQQAVCQAMQERVIKLEHIIGGNGRAGLTERLDRVETTLETSSRVNWGWIVSAVAVGSVLIGALTTVFLTWVFTGRL